MNHRLIAVRCLYRFHFQTEIPGKDRFRKRIYLTRSPLGFGRPRATAAGLQLRQPQRVVVPLFAEEVAQFWRSVRVFRDLSLVALMLLDGLRSREVLQLQLEDARLSEAQIRVRGKGHKFRVLSLPKETIEAL